MSRRVLLAALVLAVSLALLPCAASAQDTAQAPAPEPPRCEAPEHRQFDFWIGRWEVTSADGRVAGRSEIARMLDGCVIHERWNGETMQGESFNIWDRTSGQWHQTWVSSRGELLMLDGGLRDGVMQMTGESGPPERRVTNRLTWTPAAAGGVRQVWEVSRDAGKTWRVVFDGTYRRRD